MKPQHLVKFAFACLISSSIFLPSCSKENAGIYQYPTNPNQGNVASAIDVHLTASSSNATFSKVNIDLYSVEYNTSNEAGINDGWETISLQTVGAVDMKSLIHGRSIRLNSDMLPGNVKQLRIRFGSNNSVEVNGVLKPLHVENDLKETGVVLYIDMPENTLYANSLWLNLDLNESIHLNQLNDEYYLAPSFGNFDANQTGSIEGFVVPADAQAVIYINGDPNSRNVLVTESSLAETQNQGYFKFVGLPEGSYSIEMISGDGTNRRKMISQIVVKAGETNNIGSNELE